jgi:hypothetical protein
MHAYKNHVNDTDLVISAKEATYAYHTAIYGLSFKTSDCTSKLRPTLFKPKFGVARTKFKATVVNLIAPQCVMKNCI